MSAASMLALQIFPLYILAREIHALSSTSSSVILASSAEMNEAPTCPFWKSTPWIVAMHSSDVIPTKDTSSELI